MTTQARAVVASVDAALRRHRELAAVSDTPLLDCQLILAHLMGVSRSWLYAHGDRDLDAALFARFEALLAQRKAGTPVAYITGTRAFRDIDLDVTAATLVPRPETELLVEIMLVRLAEGPLAILDAGTGSGAIAVALAAARPAWQVFATDVSAEALSVARRNAARQAGDRIGLLRGNWLAAIGPACLDAVVCNPPYVRAGDPHLAALGCEPQGALVAGHDGLDAIRTVIPGAMHCLRAGGLLVMEHGFDQQPAAEALLAAAGFVNIERFQDLNRLPRALVAEKPL